MGDPLKDIENEQAAYYGDRSGPHVPTRQMMETTLDILVVIAYTTRDPGNVAELASTISVFHRLRFPVQKYVNYYEALLVYLNGGPQ